jgi:hypothetical protein
MCLGAWVELLDLVQVALSDRTFGEEGPIHNPEKLHRRIAEWAAEQSNTVFQCPRCGSLLVEEQVQPTQGPWCRHLFTSANGSPTQGLFARMELRRE